VSGKNNKILPIPETMQGISTSAESKAERSKKNKKQKKKRPKSLFTNKSEYAVDVVLDTTSAMCTN
jgi:hypothetical protein